MNFRSHLLLGAAAAGLALLAIAETLSPVARELRQTRPLLGILVLEDSSRTRTTYAAVYGPAARTLDLVELPSNENDPWALIAGIPDQPWASGPAFSCRVRLRAQSSPSSWELAAALSKASSDPLFWPRLPKSLRPIRKIEGAGALDALRLAWRFSRLRSGAVAVSKLPAPAERAAFLAGLLGRAQGLDAAEHPLEPTAEILNASDAPGVALKATKILRLRGIDVVHFGNSASPEPVSRIIIRSGAPEAAAAAAEALGCPGIDTFTEILPDAQAAVTVVLGLDYGRCARIIDGPEL
ncbi:MAG: LytR C-terminal domain-containing protein [Elusimicrobiota bacterium]|jgi:hypothetical protein